MDFPFENGFRRPICAKCKNQRANRREVQAGRRRIRTQKAEEERKKAKERLIKGNEAARACGNPVQCLDLLGIYLLMQTFTKGGAR